MARSRVVHVGALARWIGREVACSEWIMIDQERIDRFSEVTGDRQWIHIDPDRAARESPFHTTVAHGYLTLSLLPTIFATCVRIEGARFTINYGLDRVRFPAPVRSGQRVRGRLVPERTIPIDGGTQVHWRATVEIEAGDKPACVAQMVTRYYVDLARFDSTQAPTVQAHHTGADDTREARGS